MQTRDWEDSEGKKRYTTEIIAREMSMLDSRQSADNSQQPRSDSTAEGKSDENFEEDIPF